MSDQAYVVKIPVYVLAASPFEAARLALEIVRSEPLAPAVTVQTEVMDRPIMRNFLTIDTNTMEVTDEFYEVVEPKTASNTLRRK